MWHLHVDTGGTFTDCLAVDPGGRLHRAKVLSSGALRARVIGLSGPRTLRIEARWEVGDGFFAGYAAHLPEASPLRVIGSGAAGGEMDLLLDVDPPGGALHGAACELTCGLRPAALAARLVTATPLDQPMPPLSMRLGTTRGTNALLERSGAPTALFITRGFADLLEIGDQRRPELFALAINKRRLLHGAVVEVDERLAADGTVLRRLEPAQLDALEAEARRLVQTGLQAAAVALLHSYRNPAHERLVAERLRRAGFAHVSASSALAPQIRILPRAETAVADAYLGSVMRDYLDEVQGQIGGAKLLVMTSAGGLVSAASFRPSEGLLSGPAGGVAGAAAAARLAGLERVIGFDMGGTSTDVCRWDGGHEHRFEHQVGDVRLAAPALRIETVAAGGGSICSVRQGRLGVGPQSASARPGPACYGAGGPLTITDVNLLSGRLDPAQFEIPVETAAADAALTALMETGDVAGAGRDELLDGFLEIANERMAAAIERVSAARGVDPADHALIAFGGAGGQHACAVATRLGITNVVLPADASILSAVGLRLAVLERFAARQVLQTLDEVGAHLAAWPGELDRAALAALVEAGGAEHDVAVRRRLVLARLLGQDSTLAIEWTPAIDLPAAFAARYRAVYGHEPPARPIEIESLRVIASTTPPQIDPAVVPRETRRPQALRMRRVRFDGAWRDVPLFAASDLAPGDRLEGPALVLERRSTLVLEPGWSAVRDTSGALRCSRAAGASVRAAAGAEIVRHSLSANRFQHVVEEAGDVLRRTALSTNVKERLDFSVGLLDRHGELVVNAPHIPVHLGSLGLCVRAVAAALELRPGDAAVTNHPAFGGTHLPDVTVITPIFAGSDPAALLGFVACRAHHAEIGGSRPGSMPPAARTLAEEGVVIPPMHLVRGGRFEFTAMESLLRRGPWPSRAVAENLADLEAAVAAGRRAATAIEEMARADGVDEVAQRMVAIGARAEAMMRRALGILPDGRYEAIEHLDDGAAIQVCIEVRGDRAVVDFAGTAGVHPGNLNATPAIVRSAVMYVMRLLIGEALPLNEAIMRAVELRLPRGMLDPPFPDDPAAAPAVVGGNVETSQRIVEVLLEALRLCAGSQGTMNNVLFGSDRFGYYETVCGGAGAGPGFDGADAVHTHMTNTRLTDPEVLEHRYPVRLEQFAIRRGSGGRGRWRGGDGVVREIVFLAPMSLSILSQHRSAGPYGMEGGAPGAPGRQKLIRAGGEVLELDAIDGRDVQPGDRLVLETPGGGGWGREPNVVDE